MNTNQVIAVTINITAYLIGLIIGIFLTPNTSFLTNNVYLDSITIVLAMFLLNATFFGFASFLPTIIIGIASKQLLYTNPALYLLLIIPISIMIYSSNLLGENIWKELKKGNALKNNWKKIIILILIAIILTILLSYFSQEIKQLIPIEIIQNAIQLKTTN